MSDINRIALSYPVHTVPNHRKAPARASHVTLPPRMDPTGTAPSSLADWYREYADQAPNVRTPAASKNMVTEDIRPSARSLKSELTGPTAAALVHISPMPRHRSRPA